MASAIEPLAYADDVTRLGVAVDTGPGYCRVHVPPMRRGGGRGVAILCFVAFLVLGMVGLAAACFFAVTEKGDGAVAASLLAPSFLVLGAVAVLAVRRLRERLILQVDADSFIVERVQWFAVSRRVWNREELLDLSAAAIGSKLVLILRGQGTATVELGQSSRATLYIADKLAAALGSIPTRR